MTPDLLRHVDCVVMLVPADAGERAAAEACAEIFAGRIRVVLATCGEPGADWIAPVVKGRLIRVTVPWVAPRDQAEYLNFTLRQLGLMKPLIWLEDPQLALWFEITYAPLKTVVLRQPISELRGKSLSHADLILIADSAVSLADLPPGVRDRCHTLPGQPLESDIVGFSQLASRTITGRRSSDARLNIAILYDHTSTYTNTVREYLEAFALYSRHRVFYVPASNYHPNPPATVDFKMFDVVILHYSIRHCFHTLLPVYAQALLNFGGLKACFIQDEYDYTEITRQAIERLGLHVVFTCVPDAYRERVYPQERFPNVEFVQVLTGYVPLHLEAAGGYKPFKDRRFVIGYRGRLLPSWYGHLSREKFLIGTRVREACVARGIEVNIEWDETQRIYGEQWYEFMRDCRATLGTESGSNVFDDHGDIRQAIDRAVKRDPDLTYDAIHAKYIHTHDGQVRMNQISPRVFEAIALRTALVLYEGEYSGVIEAGRHYLPLKRDLSNLDDVLMRLADDDYLEGLTTRAWEDIVGSGRYGYRAFISEVDAVIDRQGYRGTGATLLTGVVASRAADERQWQWRSTDQALQTFSAFTTDVIDFEQRPPNQPAIRNVSPAEQLSVPRPDGRLRAVKWWIADALHQHPALFGPARAVYRVTSFVPLAGYRGLRGLWRHFVSAPAAEPPVDAPTTEDRV